MLKVDACSYYVCELKDNDNHRQILNFSVTTCWSRHELTFPADTTGALDDDNALVLTLTFGYTQGQITLVEH